MPDTPMTSAAALPDLPAGVWRHYKGPLYLTIGYGHDADADVLAAWDPEGSAYQQPMRMSGSDIAALVISGVAILVTIVQAVIRWR